MVEHFDAQSLTWVIHMTGTAVFAIAGALAAMRRELDVFGVVVVALVTALGGGTLRDVLLGATPVFWMGDSDYLIVGTGAALVVVWAHRLVSRVERALLIFDAAGLAVFTIGGVDRALAHGASPLIAALMGVLTGCAGGIVRDVLCNEVPLVLRDEIYATAALAGASVYLVVQGTAWTAAASVALGVATTFVIRLAALRYNLSLRVRGPR